MIVAINKDAEAPIFWWPTTAWRPTCSRPCRNWSRRSERRALDGHARHRRASFAMPFSYPACSERRHDMSYTAPLKDMLFDIEHLAGIDADRADARLRGRRPRHRAGRARGMRQVQRGRGRAAERGGRPQPVVAGRTARSRTTPGFKEAFAQYAEGGWQGLQHPADFGGQGLPKTIGAACGEMLNSANMSFALCPLLTDGAIEALLTAGSDELKADLPREAGERRVDRHHEPDRAAGRQRPGAGAHAAPSRSPTAPTRSSAPRSSSPTASTTWPRTSCTWCWRA